MSANPLTMNDQTAPRRRLPDVRFRVLIAGRANAGKTSILQRVCATTDSPKTYRVTGGKRTEFRLDPASERGQHEISDELEFSNHKGYVFHDSRGLESGTADELQIIQNFVGDRSHRKRLQERLHAIWYCIPMDGNRAGLDIEPFHNICPDKNVPVIAVFTKFETFMHMTRSDMILKDQKGNLKDECDKRFKEGYSDELGEGTKFVRLEGMQKPDARCEELIKTTMETLDTATVALMLLGVRTENLGLNVQYVVSRMVQKSFSEETGLNMAVRKCLVGFPMLWYYFDDLDDLRDLQFEDDSRDDSDLLDDLDDSLRDRLRRSLSNFRRLSSDDKKLFCCRLDSFSSMFLSSFDNKSRKKRLLEALSKFVEKIVPQTTTINSHVSQTPFGMIALILVLRYATLTYINLETARANAVEQACAQYLGSEWNAKIDTWLGVSARTEGEIIAFINSVPWDMTSKADNGAKLPLSKNLSANMW